MKFKSKYFFQVYQMVEKSPWPIMTGSFSFSMFSSFLLFLKTKESSHILFSLIMGGVIVSLWFRDVYREEMFQGLHSFKVKKNIKCAMILFIFTEIMFFFGFFWTFFHSSLSPSIEIGMTWPPVAILPINPFQVPLLNTMILLTSGVYVTYAHFLLLCNEESKYMLFLSILLGMYFSLLQKLEYSEASFGMSDSLFGSIFYMTTGFHGLHVAIGTSFLTVCFVLICHQVFSQTDHLTFEFAIWYWHFVDVVWLFLFFFVYWWGF